MMVSATRQKDIDGVMMHTDKMMVDKKLGDGTTGVVLYFKLKAQLNDGMRQYGGSSLVI